MKTFFATALMFFTMMVNAQSGSSKKLTGAQFPGGLQGWREYLEANLNSNLADSCLEIPKGKTSVQQTVIVSFKVDKTGKISDVLAENAKKVHPRLAAEAVRVIRDGPDWIPAEQNGRKVIYRQKQSITWVLSDE